jgi:hypothetical protein
MSNDLSDVSSPSSTSELKQVILPPKSKLPLKQQIALTKKTFKSAGYLAVLEIKRVSDVQLMLHLTVYHLNTKKDGQIAGEGTLLLPNPDGKFQDTEFIAAVNFGEVETLGSKFSSMLKGNVGGIIQQAFSIITQVNFFKPS